ncbi:MAG: hypothetical protein QOJ79_2563 [Actinomycetota bacterium]|jgi:hypothetical protein|nr:hypothetical protein [Actinomycetota bacterium]
MTEHGTVSALLYWEENTSRRAAFFRDASTGATSYVNLPLDTTAGWSTASYAYSATDQLTILSGNGPIYLRTYRLTGTPVPTGATLLSSQVLGDTDSRMGALVVLRSGAVVAAWHQQGSTGPDGHHVLYRTSTGATSQLDFSFLPTRSSKDALVQHPADGSIWLFNEPDAWSSIGAAHLTETAGGLTLDWTDAAFIGSADGDNDADPENPDIEAAPDPSTGTIALAYQDAHRYRFATSKVGSWVSIARISPSRTKTFVQLPVYVERISRIGLVVRPGETWVTYRPMDEATLTFDKLYVNRYADGQWGAPRYLGQLKDPYAPVSSGVSRAEFAAQLVDGTTHLFPAV